MKHWFITAILVAAAAFGGYVIGNRAGHQEMIQIANERMAKIKAGLERDMKLCFAEVERELQAGNKKPSTVCHLQAYMWAFTQC